MNSVGIEKNTEFGFCDSHRLHSFFDMSMFYMALPHLELDATFFLLIQSVGAVGAILCLLISQNPIL